MNYTNQTFINNIIEDYLEKGRTIEEIINELHNPIILLTIELGYKSGQNFYSSDLSAKEKVKKYVEDYIKTRTPRAPRSFWRRYFDYI